jgi:hypothetical protein
MVQSYDRFKSTADVPDTALGILRERCVRRCSFLVGRYHQSVRHGFTSTRFYLAAQIPHQCQHRSFSTLEKTQQRTILCRPPMDAAFETQNSSGMRLPYFGPILASSAHHPESVATSLRLPCKSGSIAVYHGTLLSDRPHRPANL